MTSTIGEVLKLQVGDVLPIELPTTVTAKVDGVPVMECGYGTSNDRYALRVQHMITHQDSDLKNDHD
jgi:flagellar motor switch protein FliM